MDMKELINKMLEPYGDLITPEQAKEFLHVGKNYIYSKIKSGELSCLKFGNSIRIPKQVFVEFLSRHTVWGE